MPLKFQPPVASVVMCDFAGFVAPEMIKVRPVVILARNRCNSSLVTVVPLSTTAPLKLEPHHHELSQNPLPDKLAVTCWAKCDMVVTIALHRLDRYKFRDASGARTYAVLNLDPGDFQAIKGCVAAALRLP